MLWLVWFLETVVYNYHGWLGGKLLCVCYGFVQIVWYGFYGRHGWHGWYGWLCWPDTDRLIYLMSLYGPHCSPLYQEAIRAEVWGTKFEFPKRLNHPFLWGFKRNFSPCISLSASYCTYVTKTLFVKSTIYVQMRTTCTVFNFKHKMYGCDNKKEVDIF